MGVRRKSSHRKQRAAVMSRIRLEPVQERSKKRNDQILDAVARLLQTVNIEDLTHSDVAKEAGISKASAHYHYPTIASIQLMLGQRYDIELAEHVERSWGTIDVKSWQEVVRGGAAMSRAWFNCNRPACEALLGPLLTRENRLAGVNYNARSGAMLLDSIRRRFVLGEQPHLEKVFSHSGEIIDLFWSGSYLRNGHIDEEAFEESLRASLGYLRNFLPEIVTPRAAPAAMADDKKRSVLL